MAIAPRIMLLAIGSLGDVHPLLALGIAARERGAEVTVGVAEEHVNSVRDAGLTPVAMVESLDRAGARVGLDKQDTRRLTLQLTGWFVNQHMVPNLRGMIEALAPSMDGQDIVCGNPLAIAAPIVAELYGLPFVPVRLQPAISLPNGFEMPQATKPVHPYPTPQERRTNTWRAAQQVAALRKSFDLPDRPPLTLLGPHGDMPMTLGLFSSLMAGFKDQFVPDFKITGFPLYDGSGGQGQLEERLERFLSDGPPPAVFTLGSYVPDLGQNFYHDSLEAARRLGLRSVLLTDGRRMELRQADSLTVDRLDRYVRFRSQSVDLAKFRRFLFDSPQIHTPGVFGVAESEFAKIFSIDRSTRSLSLRTR